MFKAYFILLVKKTLLVLLVKGAFSNVVYSLKTSFLLQNRNFSLLTSIESVGNFLKNFPLSVTLRLLSNCVTYLMYPLKWWIEGQIAIKAPSFLVIALLFFLTGWHCLCYVTPLFKKCRSLKDLLQDR
jgi:hypothetical protein